MTIRTEIITLSVFSVVIIITQGSLASTNAVVHGLTNLAAAITIQNNRYTTVSLQYLGWIRAFQRMSI
ncbi:MAG: hypothetical protein WA364_22290 [Candidatus Nitrosopolaris sp.]